MNYLIAAIVIALAGFGAGWKTQDWRHGAQEKERVETQIENERLAHKADTRREERVIAAQNAANGRAVLARRDADSARTELERLRIDIDANAQPSLSLSACNQHAAALGVVFENCATRYSDLAQTATGHASDVQTLTEAWPKP